MAPEIIDYCQQTLYHKILKERVGGKGRPEDY